MCGEYIDTLEIEDLLREMRESDTRFIYIQTLLSNNFGTYFFFRNVNEIVVHIQLSESLKAVTNFFPQASVGTTSREQSIICRET